jgi:hypothetical protein
MIQLTQKIFYISLLTFSLEPHVANAVPIFETTPPAEIIPIIMQEDATIGTSEDLLLTDPTYSGAAFNTTDELKTITIAFAGEPNSIVVNVPSMGSKPVMITTSKDFSATITGGDSMVGFVLTREENTVNDSEPSSVLLLGVALVLLIFIGARHAGRRRASLLVEQ